MRWTSLYMKIFGTTKFFGIDIGFWIVVVICLFIMVGMNLLLWKKKPLKK